MAEAKVQALALALHRLGYPTPVPSDLAARPNFEFVADCFAWLCARIDPEVSAPRDYGTEQKRAGFLAALGSQLYTRTRLKVDIRRLYRAGGSAIRELLALATALQEAAELPPPAVNSGGGVNRVAGLQQSRGTDHASLQQLATSIGSSGVQLIGALAAVPSLAQQLDAVLAAGRDVASLKAEVRGTVTGTQRQIAALQAAIAELDQEQQSLEAKVEKRHVELDRMERRLDALHAVRPAQSEEMDTLEAELAQLYQAYLQKFRNLEYLEGQLDKHNAAQEAQAEEADKAMRKIQRQMQEEEARVLQGDQNDPNHLAMGSGFSEDSEADFAPFQPKALPRLGAGVPAAGHGAMADHLLLVPDDSGSAASPGRGGSARLSVAGLGRPSGAQSASSSLRPSSAGSKRPSSAARRIGSGAGADLLVVEDGLQRLGLGEERGLPLRSGDNNF